MEPMLVPKTMSMGMPEASRILITPTWAMPKAEPPESTKAILGGRTGASAADAAALRGSDISWAGRKAGEEKRAAAMRNVTNMLRGLKLFIAVRMVFDYSVFAPERQMLLSQMLLKSGDL